MTVKKRATAEQIKAVIQKRIWESKALDGDCRNCHAPTPRPIDPARPGGPNWDVAFIGGTPGCSGFLKAIVLKAMRKYELVED